MKIGFHTDAFNSAYFSFEACLEWAQKNDVHWIECGLIDGVSWIHGLGYQPHVALYEDPELLRRKMEGYGVRFSQVDAAFPLSGKDVSESLAEATRGKKTGIAVSHCALGDGVNADNIRKCLAILRDGGYDGVLSMECEGQAGPMIERSLKWTRETLADLGIAVQE